MGDGVGYNQKTKVCLPFIWSGYCNRSIEEQYWKDAERFNEYSALLNLSSCFTGTSFPRGHWEGIQSSLDKSIPIHERKIAVKLYFLLRKDMSLQIFTDAGPSNVTKWHWDAVAATLEEVLTKERGYMSLYLFRLVSGSQASFYCQSEEHSRNFWEGTNEYLGRAVDEV